MPRFMIGIIQALQKIQSVGLDFYLVLFLSTER